MGTNEGEDARSMGGQIYGAKRFRRAVEPRSCEPVRWSAERSPARKLYTFDTDLYGSITTADLG